MCVHQPQFSSARRRGWSGRIKGEKLGGGGERLGGGSNPLRERPGVPAIVHICDRTLWRMTLLPGHPRPAPGTPMAECHWMEEEGSLFKGLPQLPKVLRAPPTHGPPAAGEHQEALGVRGTSSQRDSAPGSSLQARISWVRKELLSLQLTDLALLRQLDPIAQEIQDLRELQLQLEELFAEGELLGPAPSSPWHLCPLTLSGGGEGKAL
ncbi:unnamed protein product [Eretmochelys imbricata]